jgi:hypothetical protein
MTDLVERLRDPSSVRSWEDADRQRLEAAAEIERLRADAARYRWLRDKGDSTWKPMANRVPEGAAGIDAAIDAAMKGTP